MIDEISKLMNCAGPARMAPAGWPGAPRRLLAAVFAGAVMTAGVAISASTAAAQTAAAPAKAQAATQATAPTATPAAPTSAAQAPAQAKGGSGMGGGGMGGMGNQLDKTLSKVDATADQKAKIQSIMLTALASLAPLQPKAKEIPAQLQRLLTGPTVDRAGLEQLRLSLMADLDQASKTLVTALADAADTLTPEQRAKLAAQLAPKPKPHS